MGSWCFSSPPTLGQHCSQRWWSESFLLLMALRHLHSPSPAKYCLKPIWQNPSKNIFCKRFSSRRGVCRLEGQGEGSFSSSLLARSISSIECMQLIQWQEKENSAGVINQNSGLMWALYLPLLHLRQFHCQFILCLMLQNTNLGGACLFTL